MQDAPTQVVFNYTSIHAAQAAHEHDDAVQAVAVSVSVPQLIEGEPGDEGFDLDAGGSWWVPTGNTKQVAAVVDGRPRSVPCVEFVNVDTIKGVEVAVARLLVKNAKPGKAGELVGWWLEMLEMWSDRKVEDVGRVWVDCDGMIRRRDF